MFFARPVAVFLCLTPFPFQLREKIFISWVGLRGAVAIFLASIPLLLDLPKAQIYFNVAFIVVMVSLLLQGWTLGFAARKLHVALPRTDRGPRRIELDLPGQLEQQLVGYAVRPNSLFLKRGLIPSWSKPTLVIREEKILSAAEAAPVQKGDYLYLLAPPEKAGALDRFFVDMAPATAPDPNLLGDFMLAGDVTLEAVGEVYGIDVPAEVKPLTLADYFDIHLDGAPRVGAALPLGSIALVARGIGGNRVNVIGLRLSQDEKPIRVPRRIPALQRKVLRLWKKLSST
jgi:cell volume regulation protein A